jgi:hypothetical protein
MSKEEGQAQVAQAGDGEIMWDEQYDDPDAKIILISSDNVGFRVSAWIFKKKRYVHDSIITDIFSVFIRNLLDVPSSEPLDSAPFHLDYPSSVIRLFVHHVYGDLPINIKITTPLCKGVFELCDRFEAPQVYANLSKSVQIRMKVDAKNVTLDVWEIFKLAASPRRYRSCHFSNCRVRCRSNHQGSLIYTQQTDLRSLRGSSDTIFLHPTHVQV